MEPLSSFLKKPEKPVKTQRIDFEFQALGVELEPFYGKAIWPLFYKKGFTEVKIREAHEIAKKRGITKLPYLIGIIKKLN